MVANRVFNLARETVAADQDRYLYQINVFKVRAGGAA
jgi:hypothetical protein